MSGTLVGVGGAGFGCLPFPILKATGGIYLGGGILPQIWNETHHAIFNGYFFAVGRLHPLVEAAPVF